jgi:tRNA nucleotidyltransferase (CCA-adding enzyme)
MQPECSPQTSIHDISLRMAHHPTVVVRADTRRIGIVTARDVAAALHFGQGHMPCAVIARPVPRTRASARALSIDWTTVRTSLAPALVAFLQHLADICSTQGAQLCLVGGVVRTVCQREELTDLDVCVVGPFDAVIDAIVTATGATVLQRSPFATATLTFPAAIQATVGMDAYDIVGARHETYATIGVLPTITPVDDIRADLARRDLTVNAMAIVMQAHGALTLVDPYDGWWDLQRRRARVVHPLSFFEDPTRLVRLARIAARLDLHIDAHLRGLVRWALAADVCPTVSRFRWLTELQRTLAEADPAKPMLLLQRWGVLAAVLPGARLDRHDAALLRDIATDLRIVAVLWRMPTAALHAVLSTWSELPVELRDLSALRAQRPRWRRWLSQRPSLAIRALAAFDGAVVAAVAILEPDLAALLVRTAAVQADGQLCIRGADLVAAGMQPGPAIGRALEALQTYRWDAHFLGLPACVDADTQIAYALQAAGEGAV